MAEMRSSKIATLQAGVLVLTIGLGLVSPSAASTSLEELRARRAAAAEARKVKRDALRQEEQERKAERIERGRANADRNRARIEAERATAKQERDAKWIPAAKTPLPPGAQPSSPSPTRDAAPRLPGQPNDAEMRALIQAQLDKSRNRETRAMVDRCNAGAPKDQNEAAYCRGWFDMERRRTGAPGTMRYDDIAVDHLAIRNCTVDGVRYTCFFDIRLRGPFLPPPVDAATVQRKGSGWELLSSSY